MSTYMGLLTPPPHLYFFVQTIFDPPLPPLRRTYFMDAPLLRLSHNFLKSQVKSVRCAFQAPWKIIEQISKGCTTMCLIFKYKTAMIKGECPIARNYQLGECSHMTSEQRGVGESSVHSDVYFYCKICKLIPTKGWVGLKTGEKMLTSYVNIPLKQY